MASLQMIKEDYAKTVECENWAKFVLNAENSELLMALNIISERYAQQRVNEVLDVLQKSQEDLIILHGNIYSEIKKGNNQWDGVDEIIQNRIESNRKILKLKNNESI